MYQKVMALWHQLHMNTKSLISWNYLRKDIALVQSFSMEKVQQELLCPAPGLRRPLSGLLRVAEEEGEC